MFNKIRILLFLLIGRKRKLFFTIFSCTVFIVNFQALLFFNFTSINPFQTFVNDLSDDTITLYLGSDEFDNTTSFTDIMNAYTYFTKNLPQSIQNYDVKKTIYAPFNVFNHPNFTVIDKNSSNYGEFDNSIFTLENSFRDLLHQINSSENGRIITGTNKIEGIIFSAELESSSVYKTAEIQIIDYKENNSRILTTFTFLVLNRLLFDSANSISSNFPELAYNPKIIIPFNQSYKLGWFRGYFSTFITLELQKNALTNIVLNPILKVKYLNFLTDFHKYLASYQWEGIHNFHIDNQIVTMSKLVDDILVIFLILLALTLIPIIISILFLIIYSENIRNHTFKKDYLKKLLFRGYSRNFILFYYSFESIVIVSSSIFLSFILSFAVFETIIIQLPDIIEPDAILGFITVVMNPVNNVVFLFFLFFTLILLNGRGLFLNIHDQALKTEEYTDPQITEYQLNKIPILVFSILLILFISLTVIFSSGKEIPLFIGLLIFLFGIWLWVVCGLFFLKKIYRFFSERYELVIALNLFHKNYFSQRKLTEALFWILLISFTVPSLMDTFDYNLQRDAYYKTGADIQLQIDPFINHEELFLKLNEVPEITNFDLVYQTSLTFGTEFTSVPNMYEIIGLDPRTFFSRKSFEPNFLEGILVDEAIEELSRQGTVLIPNKDIMRLNSDIEENFSIFGYIDYPTKSTKEYDLKIIGGVKHWPSKTLKQLTDYQIQLFTSMQTLFALIDDWNVSVTQMVLIDLVNSSLSQESYNYLLNNLSSSVLLNVNVQLENKTSSYTYSNLQGQIFEIFSIIVSNATILVIVPISSIFLFYLSYRMENNVGILESIGFKKKNIGLAFTGYFFMLFVIGLTGVGILGIFLLEVISISITTPSGLELIPKIRIGFLVIIFFIEGLVLFLIALIFNKHYLREQPANLIMRRD
ncbi:MAG: hypothetical protein ACFFFG_02030 [Candidatus Thorarchaeota archaeon]